MRISTRLTGTLTRLVSNSTRMTGTLTRLARTLTRLASNSTRMTGTLTRLVSNSTRMTGTLTRAASTSTLTVRTITRSGETLPGRENFNPDGRNPTPAYAAFTGFSCYLRVALETLPPYPEPCRLWILLWLVFSWFLWQTSRTTGLKWGLYSKIREGLRYRIRVGDIQSIQIHLLSVCIQTIYEK